MTIILTIAACAVVDAGLVLAWGWWAYLEQTGA